MLIDWVRSGRTGKYLALGHGARSSLRSVRTSWPRAKYFSVRPFYSVSKYILFFSQCVSGRNSTNPAIWLVPGAGGIFPSGPLSAGGIIKNIPSSSGNLFSDLCYYGNKDLSVKSLSSSWITSVFITICLLEIVQFVANLTMITALNVRVFRTPFVVL